MYRKLKWVSSANFSEMIVPYMLSHTFNDLLCLSLRRHLQLLSSSSKSHGTDSGSESEVYPSLLLEHIVDTIEKLVAKKKRKKMSSSISLEVVQEHPVLVSTLALLLLHSPQLVSTR